MSAVSSPPAQQAPLGLRDVWTTWWPLAASWLMMSFELPAVSAVMARLLDPDIQLAAYGGVVFPIALLVEAPIIMLLAASTALSRNREAYEQLRLFMILSAATLTAIHLLVAATPLFDVVVATWMGVPDAIQEPARIGLLILTPWTASIAYRRMGQGLLIRNGHSRTVGLGTAVRLTANLAVLASGLLYQWSSGIVVGTTAVSAGVIAEAVFVGLMVRPVARALPAAREKDPLPWKTLFRFYIPLALTPMITLVAMPLVSAGLARMPRALDSLAAWPVLNGLVFAFRSLGFAFNEVVVALSDRPGAPAALNRFTGILASVVFGVILLLNASPLAWIWFSGVSGLSPTLARLATGALWLAILLPPLAVFQSRFQGALVHAGRTRGIPEAVGLSLTALVLSLVAGVTWGRFAGLYVGIAAFSLGGLLQTLWLKKRVQSLSVAP